MDHIYYKYKKWCWENGIRIYVKPIDGSAGVKQPRVNIVIEINGNQKTGVEVYTQTPIGQDQYSKKINNLYSHFYNKYNK